MGDLPPSSNLDVLLSRVILVFSLTVWRVNSFDLLSMSHGRRNYNQLILQNVTEPESIAFDCHGQGPYVGVSDGRVLKWQGQGYNLGWTEFAITMPNRDSKLCDGSNVPKNEPNCGRPLGLKFNNVTCDLYIVDAYDGLLRVGPNGGVAEQLVASAGGVPFKLTNALDVDPVSGAVYFTVSSIHYQRWEYEHAIEDGDKTGRVVIYNPVTKSVTVLVSGLYFPNGLALSRDKSFLIVAETGKLQLIKIRLRGPEGNTSQTFYELARYPYNVKITEKGEFWAGLNSGRSLGDHLDKDRLRKAAVSRNEIPWFTRDPVAIKFDAKGKVMEMVNGMYGKTFESVSEVEEYEGVLWIGSVTMPYVGKLKA